MCIIMCFVSLFSFFNNILMPGRLDRDTSGLVAWAKTCPGSVNHSRVRDSERSADDKGSDPPEISYLPIRGHTVVS